MNIYVHFDYIMVLNFLQDMGERIKIGPKTGPGRSLGLLVSFLFVVGTLFLFCLILSFSRHIILLSLVIHSDEKLGKKRCSQLEVLANHLQSIAEISTTAL